MLESEASRSASAAFEPVLPLGISNIWLGVLVLVVCIFFVAFFSSSEASLLYVSKIRIRYLAEKGSQAAQAVQRILSKHDKLFATILFTENMFIIFASSVGTAIALSLVGSDGIYLATIVMTLLIVIFGEITPKTFAAQNAERVSLTFSRPMEAIIKVVGPVIWILTLVTNFVIRIIGGKDKDKLPFVTEEEIRLQISIAQQEGIVHEQEEELLRNVFEFGDSLVREVIVPRPEVVGVPEDSKVSEFLSIFAKARHSRFPVYRGSLDDIVGVVSIKDVLLGLANHTVSYDSRVSQIVRPVLFVPETKLAGELFFEMQATKDQLAVVIDEYGGTAGIVTIEDLVEEIVGDMRDELAAEPEQVQRVDDNTLAVDGQTKIDEVIELTGVDLPEGDYDTVAGFILNELGHIPEVGESVVVGDITMTVTEMDGVRISRVQIQGSNLAASDQRGSVQRVQPS